MSTSMDSIDVSTYAVDLCGEEWNHDLYWSKVAIACDDLLQEDIGSGSFGFDRVGALSDGRPVLVGAQPLAPGSEGRQSPPQSPPASDPAFGRHPCLEASNFDIANGHYPGTSDTQDLIGTPITKGVGTAIDTPNSYFFATQERDAYGLRCIIPAPGTPVAATPASPKLDHPKPQQKVYRCESWIVKAQPPFEQTTCGKTFARSKDLKRHQSTIHRKDDDPIYLCHCGKDNPRKDNHTRHVERCAEPPCGHSYVCKCSHPSQERHDHLEHIKSCSPGKGSRRRRNAS